MYKSQLLSSMNVCRPIYGDS